MNETTEPSPTPGDAMTTNYVTASGVQVMSVQIGTTTESDWERLEATGGDRGRMRATDGSDWVRLGATGSNWGVGATGTD
eukprot:6203905-Pleurochrysis_carterae.AAC.1